MRCTKCKESKPLTQQWYIGMKIRICPDCLKVDIFKALGDALRPGQIPEEAKRLMR